MDQPWPVNTVIDNHLALFIFAHFSTFVQPAISTKRKYFFVIKQIDSKEASNFLHLKIQLLIGSKRPWYKKFLSSTNVIIKYTYIPNLDDKEQKLIPLTSTYA